MLIATAYRYDNDDRLTSQTMSLAGSGLQYGDSYAYDLDNNRMTDVHTGTLGGPAGTTTYTYNGDDENASSTLTVGGTSTDTNNTYDANGSLIQSVAGSQTTSYTYDVRNKMVGYSDSSGSATYVYDDNGNRVQETTGGTTTYYLTDTQNPTGYDQPIEQWTSSSGSRSTATLQMTYVLGNSVLAQVTGSGTISWFLVDGHGSTRALVGSTGSITSNSGTIFNYEAFGGALNFTPSSAGTVFLFGGDAVYDPVSGLYMNGDGTRDRLGFGFVQRDPTSGNSLDPQSLHKYLYAASDPVNMTDPSGDMSAGETAGTAAIGAGADALGGDAAYLVLNAANNLLDLIGSYETLITNLATEIGGGISAIGSGLSSSAAGYTLGAIAGASVVLSSDDSGNSNNSNDDLRDSRAIGEQIASGHAGEEHIEEFNDLGIYDPGALADLIEDIIDEPSESKQLTGGRTAHIDTETGTIVIVDPNNEDGGTTFRPEKADPPQDPQDYYDGLQ